jgi:hypothetical protein
MPNVADLSRAQFGSVDAGGNQIPINPPFTFSGGTLLLVFVRVSAV